MRQDISNKLIETLIDELSRYFYVLIIGHLEVITNYERTGLLEASLFRLSPETRARVLALLVWEMAF